ncbi:MAG: type II toxin-antitoxin system HicB family antitoxin, partial [Candidatus Lokiarchaeota archaeon]
DRRRCRQGHCRAGHVYFVYRGQLVFSLALGEIMEDLKGEIVALQKEKKYEVTVKGKRYAVILYPETEDGGYWIECPSLPGCASQGETVEEALEMIRDAIKGHIVVMQKKKKRVKKELKKGMEYYKENFLSNKEDQKEDEN